MKEIERLIDDARGISYQFTHSFSHLKPVCWFVPPRPSHIDCVTPAALLIELGALTKRDFYLGLADTALERYALRIKYDFDISPATPLQVFVYTHEALVASKSVHITRLRNQSHVRGQYYKPFDFYWERADPHVPTKEYKVAERFRAKAVSNC